MPKVDITLDLECWKDELSPAQLAFYAKAESERLSINKKLQKLMVTKNGEEVFSGEIFSAYQFDGDLEISDCEQSTPTLKRTYDRKPLEKIKTESPKATKLKTPTSHDDDDDEDLPLAKRIMKSREKISGTRSPQTPKERRGRSSNAGEKEKITSPKLRPSEVNSVGGLKVGIDVKDEASRTGPDSKEVTFNKLQGKTFPSLVVLARPSLKLTDSSNLNRNALDGKVKIVLMLSPAKFTEWLIQQGLLKSEQKCTLHKNNELKLGIYSESSKFPYSGGYVWISECCPDNVISVFNGSIFEGASHPPACILKLIYHWSCQTNIQNVVQWVKVDNVYIKGIYTWLRAVCTLSIHRHFKIMGGPGKYIEVGVISLGTTTHDGAQRQVKVEVLGVLDYTEKVLRLRAIEPLSDSEAGHKKRFEKILEPMANWVHKDSIIAIDLTVDKSVLLSMGYKNIEQRAASDTSAKHTNGVVMDYLRRIVPRMFQNTLSLLSRQIIQQFLDELCWREQFGTFPLQTFDSMTAHIAEQSKLCAPGESLIQRLFQAATMPFNDWSTPEVEAGPPSPKKDSPSTSTGPRRGRKPAVKETSISDLMIDGETDESGDWDDNKKVLISEVKKRSQRGLSPTRDITRSLSPDMPKRTRTTGFEELYYGILDSRIGSCAFVPNYEAPCPVCGKKFKNNFDLQMDMISHITKSTGVHCRFCLKTFADDAELAVHDLDAHCTVSTPAGSATYRCIICQTHFVSEEALKVHARKMHSRLELPYKCLGCDFRCSSHKTVIEHFYNKHNHSNLLQCPLCLQVTWIYKVGKWIQKNIEEHFFHLSRHLLKNENHKCQKCVLQFVQEGLLKLHEINDHKSLFGDPNVRRFVESTIQAPYPRTRQPAPEDLNYTKVKSFGDIDMNVVTGNLCVECDSELIEKNHIRELLACTKCRYRTCCSHAMISHSLNCDVNVNPESNVYIDLDQEMFCVCGFSSSDGNSLARHLAACQHKSAYPSVEAAQDNTVKRNMLDMLGLVRKDENAKGEGSQT